MKSKTLYLTRTALIAALYFSLTIAVPALSFGSIQFRISEAMCLLPILMPEAILGLTLGCFLSNFFFSPFGIYDMVIGSTITLIAAVLTFVLKKKPPLAALPPIVLNAVFLPLIWLATGSDTLYYINALSILLSQSVIIYLVGFPLTYILKKRLMPALERGRRNRNNLKPDIDNLIPLDDTSGNAYDLDIVEKPFDIKNATDTKELPDIKISSLDTSKDTAPHEKHKVKVTQKNSSDTTIFDEKDKSSLEN